MDTNGWTEREAPPRDFLAFGSSLYVSTDRAGIFRSNDSGLTWTATNSGLTNGTVYCIAADSGKILAGTSSGIYRSLDGGTNWTQETSPVMNRAIYALARVGGMRFTATNVGVWRSTDDGATWDSVNNGFGDRWTNTLVVSG